MDKLHDELHQLEGDLEEHQSERSVKYKELKRKEEGIRGLWEGGAGEGTSSLVLCIRIPL